MHEATVPLESQTRVTALCAKVRHQTLSLLTFLLSHPLSPLVRRSPTRRCWAALRAPCLCCRRRRTSKSHRSRDQSLCWLVLVRCCLLSLLLSLVCRCSHTSTTTGSYLGWGSQAQPVSTQPISALLTHRNELFVLTAQTLQRWRDSSMLWEFSLQQAVETALMEETMRETVHMDERVSYKYVM